MSTIDKPHVNLGTLRRHLRGVPVIGPGDEGWDLARQAFNTTIDQRPALIATPAGRRRRRRRRALRRRRRPPGRPAAHRPQRRPARRPQRLHPVEDRPAAGRQDRRREPAPPACAPARSGRRSCRARPTSGSPRCTAPRPDVSVVGYSLGGGLGWYGRKHGLAANSVTAIELVTADGELRRVDAANEPELFWALRGGGGNFGVVTALEFDLYPISEVYAGVLFFPYERSSEVLHAWHEWHRACRTRSPRSAGCCSSRRSRTCRTSCAASRSSSSRPRSSAARPTAGR